MAGGAVAAARPAEPAILVVEDDADTGTLIAECLESEGYDVAVVGGLHTALKALARRPFALVLTDALVALDLGDGRWEAVERLRHAAQRAPVVICTARRASDFADYAGRGFAGLLPKPFDLDDLLAVVSRTLDHSGGRDGGTAPGTPPGPDPQ